MQTIRSLSDLRASIGQLRENGGRVALVPTMGALHAGHLSLVRAARRETDHVIASIFVNPLQFGVGEDLDSYPRREAEDAAMLAREGVAVLWAPDVATMAPLGQATRISVVGLDAILCGAARPGHFDGVCTIVAKLLSQIQPDVALFGEKDWQQLAIIRRMTRDLDFNVDIIGVPIVREADGLALSSRNIYLSADERRAAVVLPQSMRAAAAAIASGEDIAATISAAKTAILAAGFTAVDYIDLRDGNTLESLDQNHIGARLFVAARIGKTRLIDNWPITEPK